MSGIVFPHRKVACACGCGRTVDTSGQGQWNRRWHRDCEERKRADWAARPAQRYTPATAAKGWEPSDPKWWAEQHPEIRARHGR